MIGDSEARLRLLRNPVYVGKAFFQDALRAPRGEVTEQRVCARCGKHFVGTSAVGNRYRYRYYTCVTRQRYGTKYCDAKCLPAEDLDAAVLDALLHVYERTDLFDRAGAAARRRVGAPGLPECEPRALDRGAGDHPGCPAHQDPP